MKAVLFDFNGTLFYDTLIHIDVWIQFLKEKLNYDMSKEEFMQRIFGRDNNAIIKDMFGIDDLKLVHELSEEKEEMYREVCRNMDIALVKGAEDYFDYLVENDIPFTIATGANQSNVDFYFEVFHLDKWFDYSKVIFDDGYLPGKPDPTGYLKACEKINMKPSDCIVIEDSLAGVKAAKAAGVHEIYVISDKDTFEEEVTAIVKDYHELMEKVCLKQND